ncbi:MAG: amidohydrolase family protein [Candidatus Aenigmarchaeota archaeon]|nr:amidohydrolase family protein [Candidatus Aenigmarchaeota archaeon]
MIVEGRLISHEGERFGQVGINPDTGLIEDVGEYLGTPDIRFYEQLVFPGFVDLHIHAREDAGRKKVHKETFHTMSEAAINGGVVLAGDMPNNDVPPVDDESYEAKEGLAKASLVDVFLYAGIGPGTRPLRREVPYKAYIGAVSRGGPNPYVERLDLHTRDDVEEAVSHYGHRNVSYHCEDSDVLARSAAQMTHEQRRPREAEVMATDFALYLIRKYRQHGKLCHFSIGTHMDRIRRARERYVDVVLEATPHHLYFDTSMLMDKNRLWLQVNSPLRSPDDREALIEGLRYGDIDYLATDHAPHTRDEKLKGISGIPHLDTYGAFTTWLMREHCYTPQDIARVCSYNPGLFAGHFMPVKYGRIEPGYAGSLTVIDMSAPYMVTRENLKTKCGWSPFEGMTFPGSVSCTIVRGKVYRHYTQRH